MPDTMGVVIEGDSYAFHSLCTSHFSSPVLSLVALSIFFMYLCLNLSEVFVAEDQPSLYSILIPCTFIATRCSLLQL